MSSHVNAQQVIHESSTVPPTPNPPVSAKKNDKLQTLTEHLLTQDQIKVKLATDFDASKPSSSIGLTEEEAKKRLSTYGPNILTPPKKTHPIILYLHCLGQLFNALLLVCAGFTWVLYGIDRESNSRNSYIGAILFGVALANAFIEFYQLQKSAALLASFMNMIPSNCNVFRQGQLKATAAMELVPGDIVFVRMGDKTPADIVVISSTDFKVDNSSLTGESEPLERTSKNTQENPLEATNLAFNGTLAVSGECYGVVVQTGDSTVLGQIANLTQGEAKRASPLSEEIERFVKIISAFAISSAVIFFIVAYFRSSDQDASTNVRLSFALNFAIGILVAWVPQGLPATVSMLLTIAAKRMSKKQVLVKDLQGVETLGAITLLATDKTGTLTRNQMTVSNIWTSLKLMVANSSQNVVDGEIEHDPNLSGVEEITLISALCTKARFISSEAPVPNREIIGDATESGLYRFASNKLSKTIDTLEDIYPKVFEIPFNSDNKWHMSIHSKPHSSGPYTQFMKGAPERVLRICSKILIDGEIVPLTEEHKQAYTVAYETMAGKGHRVLAFAQNLLDGASFPANFVFDKETKNYPTTELCFVGLASLEDPPKHGVREAIGHCREAGIKVMMVTGDHPLTAEAIGRKINMILSETKVEVSKRTGRPIGEIQEHEYDAVVIHGEKIDDLTDEDWDTIFAKDEIIFARTSPKHKLQIVKRAQAVGHIVGVTGDGVNDSPALKTADLGIAMNISGSDVSKEAASMILLDDNFASTVNGIAEGRLIFVNLKKSIQYVVTHIIPEVLPFLLNVIIPIPAALDSLQILVIDLGFELLAALSYAWEPAESPSALMKVPPRRPVTQESVERLRRRKARHVAAELPHGQEDPETGVVAKPSFGKRFVHGLKALLTKNFWINRFEKPEGEILVDGNLLSWAYLEVGIIEFIGCTTAFFVVFYAGNNPRTNSPFRLTPYDTVQVQREGGFASTVPDGYSYTTGSGILTSSDLNEALRQAHSIYFLGIMIVQMFNLFACKCRMGIPFGKYPLSNYYTWGSVVAGVSFAMFFVYVPPVNSVFDTSYHLSPLFWLIPFAFGWIVLFYATLRILWRWKFNPTQFNADIPNLQMFPTRWSTRRTNTK